MVIGHLMKMSRKPLVVPCFVAVGSLRPLRGTELPDIQVTVAQPSRPN